MFCPDVIDELRLLQDRVPPFGFRRVRAIVERELGARLETHFRKFDRVPVAAGGIAQVHHAILLDGTEVAVKVIRPRIRTRVGRDAVLLLWLAHVLHALSPRARAGKLIGHTRSLIAGIIAQTELRHEGRNYDRFRREFADSQTVAFPHVHMALSTRNVLVMEFIHGVTLDQIRAEQVPHVTRVLREAFFAMCFDHGLVHADLHPGNILVRADGVVALLDAGLVKHLPTRVVDQVVELARCLVLGDEHDLVRHLQTYHQYLVATDWDAVSADAHAFVADLRSRSMAEMEVSSVVNKLFTLARKHHIQPMPELSLVLLGMVTIEGIAKRLDPAANTMTEIAKFLGPRIARGRRLARGSRDWRPVDTTPAIAPTVEPGDAQTEPDPDVLAIPRTPTRTLPR